MFRSVHTMSRICNHSNASVSRFLLLSCNTVPKTASLGSVSSIGGTENKISSIFQEWKNNKFHQEIEESGVAFTSVSSEPGIFQPWQISIHNHSSASGFAILGRKVLMNAHVVPHNTTLKVRNHGSLTNPNEAKTKSEPKKVKTKKTKARVKTKSKAKVAETRRTMFNKQHRGKLKGTSSSDGNHICFGKYALQTLESAYITSRQIEAGRRVMAPNVRRGGKIWVHIFPDRSVTAKPTEMRMGRGKGAPSHCVAVVKRGKILYEMTGVSESIARKAISTAASKMPIRTQFVVSE